MEFPMIVVLPVPFALGIPGVARTVGESAPIGRTRSPPVRHLVGIGRGGWGQASRTAIGAHGGDGMHDLHRPRLIIGIANSSRAGRMCRNTWDHSDYRCPYWGCHAYCCWPSDTVIVSPLHCYDRDSYPDSTSSCYCRSDWCRLLRTIDVIVMSGLHR